jgi:hypothetical protein
MVHLEVVGPASECKGRAEDMVATEEVANGFPMHGVFLVSEHE